MLNCVKMCILNKESRAHDSLSSLEYIIYYFKLSIISKNTYFQSDDWQIQHD